VAGNPDVASIVGWQEVDASLSHEIGQVDNDTDFHNLPVFDAAEFAKAEMDTSARRGNGDLLDKPVVGKCSHKVAGPADPITVLKPSAHEKVGAASQIGNEWR